MKIILLVHISQSLQSLEHNIANNVLRKQLPPILHDFKHVLIQVLKHKMQCFVLQNNLLQIHNVRVRQFYQWLHLLLIDARIPPIITFLHLFNGDNLASLLVHGLDDWAVGAITYDLDGFILIHFCREVNKPCESNNYRFWNYIIILIMQFYEY